MKDEPSTSVEAQLPADEEKSSNSPPSRFSTDSEASSFTPTARGQAGQGPQGRPFLFLTFHLDPPMALVASSAETPRALTPTSQAEYYSPAREANSPIDSIVELYANLSPEDSPRASLAGMMRSGIETGLSGEYNITMKGPSMLAQSLPADQLPDHQARQLANFGQPWHASRHRMQGYRPPSSASHREMSLTSEHGSYKAGGSRLSRPRCHNGRTTPFLPPRPHSRANTIGVGPYRNPSMVARRSDTNLRTFSASSQVPRPIRGGFARGQMPRSHSPALSEYAYGRRDFSYLGRSSSPSIASMHHLSRRNQSTSTLRDRDGFVQAALHMPPMPRTGSPAPFHGQNVRARASSSLSSGTQARSRPLHMPRAPVELAQGMTAAALDNKTTSDYFDYTENFTTQTEDIIDSYVEDERATPEPNTQTDTDLNHEEAMGPLAVERNIFPQVESPSPIAANHRIIAKRLSVWAKSPVVEKESDFEASDTETPAPVFGIPNGLAMQLHSNSPASVAIGSSGPPTGYDRTTENADSRNENSTTDNARTSGDTTGKAVVIEHDKNQTQPLFENKADQATDKNNVNAETSPYRIPSMQFSSLTLSPNESTFEASAQTADRHPKTHAHAAVNDEPSLTDGFLDMVQGNAGAETVGSLGKVYEPSASGAGISSGQGRMRRHNGIQRQHSGPNVRSANAYNSQRFRAQGRPGYVSTGVPRPDSEFMAWNVNPPPPGQNPPPEFKTSIPPRTSSRRPGGLSDVDEESVGGTRKRGNPGVLHRASATDPEASTATRAGVNHQDYADRRSQFEVRLNEERKKYDEIEQEYGSFEDDGDGRVLTPGLAENQRGNMEPDPIPRLELTRATGSTGRSLTQSDHSIEVSQYSQRIKDHLAGGRRNATAQGVGLDVETRQRVRTCVSDVKTSGGAIALSSGQQAPQIPAIQKSPSLSTQVLSSSSAFGGAQAEQGSLGVKQHHRSVISKGSEGRRSAGKISRDDDSSVQGADTKRASKVSSLSKASPKPHKGPLKGRIKGWLAKRGLWKGGKAKAGRLSGRTQSEHGV